MKKSTTLALAGTAALAAGLTFAGPVQAAPGDSIWAACATTDVSTANRPDAGDCDADAVTVVGKHEVKFSGKATANIEALKLPWQIEAGDAITFEYTGPCGGGAPRVYITVNGIIFNTADAAVPCGTDGKVIYELPAGAVGRLAPTTTGGWDVAAAGVVRDSGAEGDVTVKNVYIGGRQVNFQAVVPTPTPTVTATPTATATATASPTASATATATASPTGSATTSTAPVPSQSTTAAGLPVTGASGGKLAAIAAALLAAGAGALVVARRRRDKVSFTA